MKKALISPMEPVSTGYRVAQVEPDGNQFEVAQPLFWVDCDDSVNTEYYFYNPDTLQCEITPAPVPTAIENESAAKQILTDTDWTQLPSVSDPAQSTPYLTNADEFAAYRSQIRDIAINPVAGNIDWPVQPTPAWSQT